MIDLHMHTIHSDGTDTVKELLQKAEAKKLEIISITDHNSVDAYYELEQSPELRQIFTGKLIVGSEIKTTYKGVNIEILAYGIDYKKIKIVKEDQQKVQKEIMQYFKEVGKKLGLTFDEKIQPVCGDTSKQFAGNVFSEEILKYKENKEIIEKIGRFATIKDDSKDIPIFYRIHESNPNSPFYFNTAKYYKNIDETIEEIHKAGGLAFLAHGYMYPFEEKDKVIEEILKTTNIDGLECEYPVFSEEQRMKLKELCKKYKKFMSGGSDYHALNKSNIDMGTGIDNNLNINKELIQDWMNKVKTI